MKLGKKLNLSIMESIYGNLDRLLRKDLDCSIENIIEELIYYDISNPIWFFVRNSTKIVFKL